MSTEQFNKAKDIIDKINALKNSLDKINSDIKQANGESNYSVKYSIQNTSLVLYKNDILILLGNKRTWLNNEIAFLEKQFKSIQNERKI